MSGTYGLRKSIEQSEALVRGHYPRFDGSPHNLQQVDFEIALKNRKSNIEIAKNVGIFASLLEFDAYVGVPKYGEDIADMVGVHYPEKSRIRVARMGSTGFVWHTPEDRQVSESAERVLIVDTILGDGVNISRIAEMVGRAKSQSLVVVEHKPSDLVADIPGVAMIEWPLTEYPPEECVFCLVKPEDQQPAL